jgi:hypothetical protein
MRKLNSFGIFAAIVSAGLVFAGLQFILPDIADAYGVKPAMRSELGFSRIKAGTIAFGAAASRKTHQPERRAVQPSAMRRHTRNFSHTTAPAAGFRLNQTATRYQTWGWTIMAGANPLFEDNIADYPGAMLAAGINYRHTKDLVISGGLIGSHYELHSIMLPWLGLDIQPGDRQGISGTIGFPSTRLVYQVNQKYGVGFSGGYESRIYSLQDYEYAGPDEGYYQDSAFTLGMDLSVNLDEGASAGFGLEYLFAREQVYYDSNGSVEKSRGLNNSLGAFFKLQIEF